MNNLFKNRLLHIYGNRASGKTAGLIAGAPTYGIQYIVMQVPSYGEILANQIYPKGHDLKFVSYTDFIKNGYQVDGEADFIIDEIDNFMKVLSSHYRGCSNTI